jgi:hypothetical protein
MTSANCTGPWLNAMNSRLFPVCGQARVWSCTNGHCRCCVWSNADLQHGQMHSPAPRMQGLSAHMRAPAFKRVFQNRMCHSTARMSINSRSLRYCDAITQPSHASTTFSGFSYPCKHIRLRRLRQLVELDLRSASVLRRSVQWQRYRGTRASCQPVSCNPKTSESMQSEATTPLLPVSCYAFRVPRPPASHAASVTGHIHARERNTPYRPVPCHRKLLDR